MDDTLRSKESALLRLDRLLVSGGARLVLFLPLLAIVLLAHVSHTVAMTLGLVTRPKEVLGGFFIGPDHATALLIPIMIFFY